MAKRYNVAPVTVREAFRLLTQEGLIRARRGSGTFVNETPLRLTSPVTEAGWPQLPQNLREHRGRILEADDATPPLLPHEGTPAAAYRRMRRVHLDERSEPFRVVELFVARHYYDQAPRRFDQEMALVVLEELDAVHLVEMRQNFTLTIADADVAAHLGLRAGEPLGRLRRSLVDPQGVVVYFSIALIVQIGFRWPGRCVGPCRQIPLPKHCCCPCGQKTRPSQFSEKHNPADRPRRRRAQQ